MDGCYCLLLSRPAWYCQLQELKSNFQGRHLQLLGIARTREHNRANSRGSAKQQSGRGFIIYARPPPAPSPPSHPTMPTPPSPHPCLLPLHAPVCQLCTQLRLAYINSCFCEFLHPECSFRFHLSLLFYCYEEIISRPFLDENLFGKSVPELNEYRECNRLFFSSPPGTFLLPPHATAPAASICQTNKSTGPVHLSLRRAPCFFLQTRAL